MSEAKIKICDLCGKEYDSRKSYHWSDCVGRINMSFKDHAGLQVEIIHDVCSNCGMKIKNQIEMVISAIKKDAKC